MLLCLFFFFSSRRRHTRCALVTGVQTCDLPISSLFHNPFTRLPLHWAGYIGDSNPTQLVADCVATLKAGHSLMIFSEGTLSYPGPPLQAPHGTARIAIESGAPEIG